MPRLAPATATKAMTPLTDPPFLRFDTQERSDILLARAAQRRSHGRRTRSNERRHDKSREIQRRLFLASSLCGCLDHRCSRPTSAGRGSPAGTADAAGGGRSSRPIETIASIDRLAATISYTYLRRQHGFRSKNLLKFVSLKSGGAAVFRQPNRFLIDQEGSCPFVPSSASANRFRPWRERASASAAPSASATPPILVRS